MKREKNIRNFITNVAGNSLIEINAAPWVDELENKTGLKFPPSFGELLRKYAFSPFEKNGIYFFGNSGNNLENDLNISIFKDRILSEAMLKNGFLRFGGPSDGSYDPICFNTQKKSHNREYEIVRLDHEQLLINGKAVIKEVLAVSFLEFIKKTK